MLDVGCGTGRLAAALVERWACTVWGVDASPEMLEVARGRLPPTVALRRAAAERLPFRDGWFERVTMTLVLHHTTAAAALAEAYRVLRPGGILAILTFDRSHFAAYYLNEYFPSLADADRGRFAPREALEEGLRGAGFADVRAERLRQEKELSRDEVLRRVEGRHISTFALLPEQEYETGLARARAELPERVRSANELLFLVGRRP